MKSIYDKVDEEKAVSLSAKFNLEKNDEHKNKVLLFLSILGTGDLDNLLPHMKNGNFSLGFKVPALSLPKEIKKTGEEFLGHFLDEFHNVSLASIFLLSNRMDLLDKSLSLSGKKYDDDELLDLVSKVGSSSSSNKTSFNLINVALYYDNLEIMEFYKKHTQVENHNMISDFYNFIKIKEETHDSGLSKKIYPKNTIHHFIDDYIIPFRQSKDNTRSVLSSMNSFFSQGFVEKRIIQNNDYEAFKKLADIGHFKNKKTLKNIFSDFIPKGKEEFLRLYRWYCLNEQQCKQKKPILLDIFNEDFNNGDIDFWEEILEYEEIRNDFVKQAQNKEGSIKLVPSLGQATYQLNVLEDLEEKDLVDKKFIDQKIWDLFAKTRSKRIQETLFFSKLVEYDASYSELFDRYNLFEKAFQCFLGDRNFNFPNSSNMDNIKWVKLWNTNTMINKALEKPLRIDTYIYNLSDKYICLNEINKKIIDKNLFFKHLHDTLDKKFGGEPDFIESCFLIYQYMAEKEKPLLKHLNKTIDFDKKLSKRITNNQRINQKDKTEKQAAIFEISLSLQNISSENKKIKKHRML